METIKVIQIGIGPIGQKIVEQITKREGIELVGAVDINSKIICPTSDTIS